MKPINIEHIAMKPILCSLALLAGACLLPGCASSRSPKVASNPDEARAYFEVLRSDFNSGKIRTLNQVMKLTVPEADKFWPIYRNYEKDLAAVGDAKLALIREFFTHYKNGTLNDQLASDMAPRWLANVQARLDLWKQYHQQISDALSPMRAAQFLQVEHQMALFVDLQIASEMPQLAPSPGPASAK